MQIEIQDKEYYCNLTSAYNTLKKLKTEMVEFGKQRESGIKTEYDGWLRKVEFTFGENDIEKAFNLIETIILERSLEV